MKPDHTIAGQLQKKKNVSCNIKSCLLYQPDSMSLRKTHILGAPQTPTAYNTTGLSFVTSCISMVHSWMGGPSCDWHNGFQSVMLTCLICDTDTGVQLTMSVCRFGWRLMAVALCLLWYTAQRSPPCVHLLISIFSYTSQAYATWIPPIIPLPSSHKTSGCAFASCSQQAFSVCSP